MDKNSKAYNDILSSGEPIIDRLQKDYIKWADRCMIAEKYIPTSRFAEYQKEVNENKEMHNG